MDDLSDLTELTVAAITDELFRRYERNSIYVCMRVCIARFTLPWEYLSADAAAIMSSAWACAMTLYTLLFL